jgi:hypothetical protein
MSTETIQQVDRQSAFKQRSGEDFSLMDLNIHGCAGNPILR